MTEADPASAGDRLGIGPGCAPSLVKMSYIFARDGAHLFGGGGMALRMVACAGEKQEEASCRCLLCHVCDSNRIQTCNLLIRSQMLYSVELWSLLFGSDRDRIQTCNLLIRSQMLYSVELRDRLSRFGCKFTTYFFYGKINFTVFA